MLIAKSFELGLEANTVHLFHRVVPPDDGALAGGELFLEPLAKGIPHPSPRERRRELREQAAQPPVRVGEAAGSRRDLGGEAEEPDAVGACPG